MSPDQFKRLQDVFDQASRLPPKEQEAFLADECGDDPELLSEARSLLRVDREESGFLDTGAFGPYADLAGGDRVGPYQIVREIGRGGIGVVYLAEDTRLRREVALKALSPLLRASEKQKARFVREAETAAAISHPGIATIYSLEEWDSVQFIVSEYVPGKTLAEELRDGALTADSVIDAGAQLSDALLAAHKKGIVHRDLKPANIMRTPEGSLKILDFGIAKSLGRDDDSHITAAGALMGTPAYMSPEQLRGQDIDERSDVFALGIILSEAAAGEHPFDAKTSAVTVAAILHDEPLGLRRIEKSSPGLASLISRCLEKDAAERIASIEEFKQALSGMRPDDPASLPPAASASLDQAISHRWWVSHQLGVVAFCSLLTVGLWYVSAWSPSSLTELCFVAGSAAATVVVTMRLHLLFTWRFNRSAVGAELERVGPWLRRFDWLFALALAVSALGVLFERKLIAAVLVGCAVGYLAVSSFVEPATRSAVFPDDDV